MERKNTRKSLSHGGLVHFETLHSILKEKKIKCLFQTNVPPVVYDTYKEEQDEEQQPTLLTENTRGISIVIHFFIFIFG